jgi:prepilin-type N-terminal cleavage/methylation domain-containing protein
MIRQQGFTLIEMAVVLAVIGLLVGGSLIALAPVLDKAHTTQTNVALDQIENALVLFAIRNNRLPCPADGSLTNTNASYGVENGGATLPNNGGQCGVTVANSVIPWKTLGLDESYSTDGWGNRIAYFPANGQIAGVGTLINEPTHPCLARNTSLAQNRATGTICDSTDVYSADTNTYPFGNYLAVYSISGTACSTELTTPNTALAGAPYAGTSTCTTGATTPVAVTTTNATTVVQYDGGRAAYVLISHGKSGWYAWNKGGKQITAPAPTRTLKQYNSNGSAGTAGNLGFVQGTPILINGSANYFDDIVRWRAPAFIIQLCGSGACGNP